MTTSGAASWNHFVNLTTFPFQWLSKWQHLISQWRFSSLPDDLSAAENVRRTNIALVIYKVSSQINNRHIPIFWKQKLKQMIMLQSQAIQWKVLAYSAKTEMRIRYLFLITFEYNGTQYIVNDTADFICVHTILKYKSNKNRRPYILSLPFPWRSILKSEGGPPCLSLRWVQMDPYRWLSNIISAGCGVTFCGMIQRNYSLWSLINSMYLMIPWLVSTAVTTDAWVSLAPGHQQLQVGARSEWCFL